MSLKKGDKRDKNGRFLKGVGGPGRPPGAVAPKTLAARRYAASRSQELMERAVDDALAGDQALLRLFTEKIIGKHGLDVGVKVVGNSPLEMLKSLFEQMRKEGISAADTQGVNELVRTYIAAAEFEDIERRLEALENAQ